MSRRLFTASWTDDFFAGVLPAGAGGPELVRRRGTLLYGTEPLRSLKDLQGKTIRAQDSQIDAAENNGLAYYFMDCPE